MKKNTIFRTITILLFAAILLISAVGCKGETLKDDMDIEALTDPFWTQDVMYNESVLFIQEGEGVPQGRLYFPATEIMWVKDASLNTVFEEGVDYVLKDGNIEWVEGSSMPYINDRVLKCEEDLTGIPILPSHRFEGFQDRVGGGHVFWTEGTGIIDRQVVVTYRHEAKWTGPTVSYRAEELSKTLNKLQNKEALTVLMFGDSISTGCNTSGFYGIDPEIPTFPELICQKLTHLYGGEVNLKNSSVGGMLSDWGAKNVTDAMEKSQADLMFLAFGMNDGSWDIPIETYKANTKETIDNARKVNPYLEIVLVGTMVGNPDAKNVYKKQDTYIQALDELAAEYEGIVTADVGAVQKELLTKKVYADMTANNINHPNDFMARLYAMCITALFTK